MEASYAAEGILDARPWLRGGPGIPSSLVSGMFVEPPATLTPPEASTSVAQFAESDQVKIRIGNVLRALIGVVVNRAVAAICSLIRNE